MEECLLHGQKKTKIKKRDNGTSSFWNYTERARDGSLRGVRGLCVVTINFESREETFERDTYGGVE